MESHTPTVEKDARTRLLDGALAVIRAKGYSAATVDDLCREAGVTKGGFFHHFRSKEGLAVAAAAHFGEMAEGRFAQAGFRDGPDPVARLLAYVDFRRLILQGELLEFTCLLGTMVQETYGTHPLIRAACEQEIFGHAETLVADIAAAQAQTGRAGEFSAESLAAFTQAVIQGAFILAKARGGRDVAGDSLDHLRRYLELLFDKPDQREETP